MVEELLMVIEADIIGLKKFVLAMLFVFLAACAGPPESATFHDPDMDFAALQAVAVMPFENLTRDKLAAQRVRDTFMNNLLSTSPLYVIPPGEVARGIERAAVVNPTTPSAEDILKLAVIIKAHAVITGVVREYGEVRSGRTRANMISLSAQMHEVQTGTVVWTASSTKGGISIGDRLFGGGGQPMNDVTEAAVDDLIEKLFAK
jgi:hypothetical protein